MYSDDPLPDRVGSPQVLEEQLGRRGEAVAPLRPTLVRALADVQERVTFRAHTFIRVRPPRSQAAD